MISNEEAHDFIEALGEPIIKPLINDWYNNQYTIEQFVAHVFISGVMFAGTVKDIQKESEDIKRLAIAAWNTRPAPLPKEREEALEALDNLERCEHSSDEDYRADIKTIRAALSNPADKAETMDRQDLELVIKDLNSIPTTDGKHWQDGGEFLDRITNYAAKQLRAALQSPQVDVEALKNPLAKYYDNEDIEIDTKIEGLNECVDHLNANGYLGGGWQPIESAPRDGTMILVYKDKQVSIVKWGDGDDISCGAFFKTNSVFYHEKELSHWMPLPKPPIAKD